MHIPQEYGEFEKPTLIAVTDSTRARLFLGKKNVVEEIGAIESNYPSKEDIERTSGEAPSGARFAESAEQLKITSREKLYTALSKDLMLRLQKEEFEDLALAAPKEHIDEMQESLHMYLVKRTKAWIPKLLTNEDMLDIVIHAKEEM